MLRSSQNTYFEPNIGKFSVISELLTTIAPYVTQKANEYISLARKDINVAAHPKKEFYADLPFSGTLNQILAGHASAQARSIINKVVKALKSKPEDRSKSQTEIVAKWKQNIKIESIKVNLNLDERVVAITDGTGHDYWIDFKFPGMRKFSLPMRKTKHMRQLAQRGYSLKRTALRINQDGSINLSYHKDVSKKEGDNRVGIDMGRGKAIARSDGYVGTPLEGLLAKIDRKRRGNKAYQRAKAEISHATNRAAKNDIDYLSFDELVIEKLKDMKRNKSWGNRSHHWRVGLLRQRVLGWAEEFGVRVIQVNPAYTSQTCSDCGHQDKENRDKDRFRCLRCGLDMDADINAARVIEQRGAYVSLLRQQRNLVGMGVLPVLTG
jgi:IS605 OrfB family transposase